MNLWLCIHDEWVLNQRVQRSDNTDGCVRLTDAPADWAHVVSREDSDLASVHGGALEPAVLTTLQHQEHLSLPQL